MSETPPTYDLAQRAHLKTRALADADLITNYGGEYDEHGHLGPDPTRQEELQASQVPQQALVAEVGSQAVTAAAERPVDEEGMSHEELEAFVRNHVYGVGMEGRRGYTQMVHKRRVEYDDRKVLYDLANFETSMPREEERQEEGRFNGLGVAEVVSLIPAETFFNNPKVAGFSVLEYKTLVKGQDKYIYDPQTHLTRREQRSRKPRGGQYFGYRVVAKTDEVQEIWQTLRQDPQVVRNLADMMVMDPELIEGNASYKPLSDANRRHFQEKWQRQVRPPYDDWKEVNGGVNRVAFRSSPDQTPEQCEIVEF
jgi:hypothetical protein